MKKFVLRLLLFCLLPLPALYALAYVIDSGLKKSRHFYYAAWNDLFNGTINADLVVLGTSRAMMHFSPKILDSTLQLNSYNLGMDAAPFKIQFERFKIYLRYNKKPKYVIQEVGYTIPLMRNNELPHPQQFLPYLHDTAIWRITSSSGDPFHLADRYFPVYKYNNELPLIAEGVKCYFGKGVKSQMYKGYLGQGKLWDSSFAGFKKLNPDGVVYPIDQGAVALFEEYLDFCKTNDIRVFLVYPPVFIESNNYIKNLKEIIDTYTRLSAAYNVPFYNYMYDSLNYNTANFYNSRHLNKWGAELFSRKLGYRMQEDIK